MTYRCYEDIKTQSESLYAALDAVDAVYPEVEGMLEGDPTEVAFVSCGSPYYIGLSNASLWRELAGVPAAAFPASEFMLFGDSSLPRRGSPFLITASRSGETTETLEAVKLFERRFPGRSVLVGCKENSALGDVATAQIVIPEAYEDVIPQTRSFTAMYLAVQYLVARSRGDEGLVSALRTVPEAVSRLIDSAEDKLREAAGADWNTAVFLGGGPLFGVATEGSLKLIEMALERVSVYQTLEVRHGPRSVIDEDTLVVSLGSYRGDEQERGVLSDLSRQTSRILDLTPSNREPENGSAATCIAVDPDGKLPEHALGLLYAPLLQLLAYHRAVRNGVDPDRSKNLTSYVELPGSA